MLFVGLVSWRVLLDGHTSIVKRSDKGTDRTLIVNGIPVSGIRPPAKPAALEEILQGEIKSSLLSETYLRLYHLLNPLVGWRAGVIIGIHHELYQLCSKILQYNTGMLKGLILQSVRLQPQAARLQICAWTAPALQHAGEGPQRHAQQHALLQTCLP